MARIGREKEDQEKIQALLKELMDLKIVATPEVKQNTAGVAFGCWEYYRRMRDCAAALKRCDLDGVPGPMLGALSGQLDAALRHCRMLESQTQAGWSGQAIATLFSEMQKDYPAFYVTVLDAANRVQNPVTWGKAVDELKASVDLANTQVVEAKAAEGKFLNWYETEAEALKTWRNDREKEWSQLRERMEGNIKAMDDLMKEAGIKHHAIRFSKEARARFWEGWAWLAALVILVGGLIYYAHVTETEIISKAAAQAWPLLAVRAVILSLGSVIVFVCVRSFSAARHNMTVNRHRENALSTFDLLNRATEDPETKKIVLLEATKAIFTPTDSGYLKAASEGTPITQIVETVSTKAAGGGHG